MTSATCIQGKSATKLSILVGTNLRTIGGYIYGVLRVKPHEFYESQTFFNDVGLVQSTSYFTFTTNVQPVELISRVVTDVSVVLSGWGYTFVSAISQLCSHKPNMYDYNRQELDIIQTI